MIQRLAKIKSIMKAGIFIFDSRSELKLNPLIGRINKNKQGKTKSNGSHFLQLKYRQV